LVSSSQAFIVDDSRLVFLGQTMPPSRDSPWQQIHIWCPHGDGPSVFTLSAITSGARSPVTKQNTVTALRINASLRRSATNADKLPVGAKIPPSIDERWGGQRSSIEPVDVEELELRPGGEDERLAVVIGEKDLTVYRDR